MGCLEVNGIGSRLSSAAAGAPAFRSAGEALHARGLAVRVPAAKGFQVTAAAWLVFGARPAGS